MRSIVNTLLTSITQLTNVLLLVLFFFTIFAIFGINIWSGVLRFRCRETELLSPTSEWPIVEDDLRVCNGAHTCEIACGSDYEPPENTFVIPDESTWKYAETNFGYTNFDNVLAAFLTIFQCSTLEGWTSIMYLLQDANSYWISALYFIALILICSYFILNLTIAVM